MLHRWAMLCAVLVLLPLRGDSADGDPRYFVSGSVVTHDGDPATSVTIHLEISDMRIRREVAWEKGLTDARGEFRIDISEHREIPHFGFQFTTWSRDYMETVVIEVVRAEDLPASVTLTVRPGSVARGVVIDDEKKPIAGVTVGTWGVKEAKSDAEGRFELVGMPGIGETRIRAVKPGYADAFGDFRSDEPGVVEGIEITMLPAAELSGVALDPLGEPIAEGLVILRKGKDFLRAELGSDGAFSLKGVPLDLKDVTLEFYCEDYPAIKRPPTPEEMEQRRINFQAEWALTLSGVVLTPAGQPLPGARVVVGDAVESRPMEFKCDEEGRFLARPFRPGETLLVTAYPINHGDRRYSGDFEFVSRQADGKWRAVVQQWPEGYSSEFTAQVGTDGNVTMERRDSGPGAFPGVVLYEGKLDRSGSIISGRVSVPAIEAQGEFRMRAYDPAKLMPGGWDLREQIGEGKALASPRQVRIKGAPFSGTQRVELQLLEPLSISGRVVDADGTPLTEGTLLIRGWNRTRLFEHDVRIEADGSFLLTGVPEGVLEAIVLNELHRPASGPLFIRGGLEGLELRTGANHYDEMDELD